MSSPDSQAVEYACICPRTDGYRIKRRGCSAHAQSDHAYWRQIDRRTYGTETPNEPTDEFIIQAFAEGARSLWPDSRDPGWQVTFRRWLAAHDERLIAWAADRCCTCHVADPPHEEWCVALGVLSVLAADEDDACTCVVGICRENAEDGCCESDHCPASPTYSPGSRGDS